MNAFEKKALRYDFLAVAASALESRETWYQTIKTDPETGETMRDSDGRAIYEDPEKGCSDYERLAVLREVIADFEKWALR